MSRSKFYNKLFASASSFGGGFCCYMVSLVLYGLENTTFQRPKQCYHAALLALQGSKQYHLGTLTKIKFNLFHGRQVYKKRTEHKPMLASHIIYIISLQYTLTTKTVVLCRGMTIVKAIMVFSRQVRSDHHVNESTSCILFGLPFLHSLDLPFLQHVVVNVQLYQKEHHLKELESSACYHVSPFSLVTRASLVIDWLASVN